MSVASYAALVRPRTPPAAGQALARLARDARVLRGELRRRRADLLVAVTTVLPAALLAARLEGVPAIVYAAELHDRGAAAAALTRATAALASGIVCCSRAVAAQFERNRTPTAVAYPPIAADCAAGDRARGRARWGVEGADPCVAVVGNLSRGRGQDVALRALPAILRQAPKARLLLVGEPHPRAVDRAFAAELGRLARELRLGAGVVFAGAVREMADVYAAADVVVNPARRAESFGRVAPEALAAGRPPVVTDLAGVGEAIRAGVDGLVVAPERPDALAGAVLDLWRDPALARRLVAAGAKHVADRFGAEQDIVAWRSVVGAATRSRA